MMFMPLPDKKENLALEDGVYSEEFLLVVVSVKERYVRCTIAGASHINRPNSRSSLPG